MGSRTSLKVVKCSQLMESRNSIHVKVPVWGLLQRTVGLALSSGVSKIWRSNCEGSPIPAPGIWDFSVDKWFSTKVGFAPRGHLTVFRDIFGCHSWWRGGPIVV